MQEKIEKILIKCLPFITKTRLCTLDVAFIKYLSQTKIDSLEEYINIRIISFLYYDLYLSCHLSIYDKIHNAEVLLEELDNKLSFAQRLPLAKEGITMKWYTEISSFVEEIKRWS